MNTKTELLIPIIVDEHYPFYCSEECSFLNKVEKFCNLFDEYVDCEYSSPKPYSRCEQCVLYENLGKQLRWLVMRTQYNERGQIIEQLKFTDSETMKWFSTYDEAAKHAMYLKGLYSRQKLRTEYQILAYKVIE